MKPLSNVGLDRHILRECFIMSAVFPGLEKLRIEIATIVSRSTSTNHEKFVRKLLKVKIIKKAIRVYARRKYDGNYKRHISSSRTPLDSHRFSLVVIAYISEKWHIS